MDRVREAIDKLKGITYVTISYLPSIEQYLHTGDPVVLKKITPFGQRGSFWGHRLAEALRPLAEWEDVDRRLIHVLHAADLAEYVCRWLDRQLGQEKPSEDVHGAVRRELEAVGDNQNEIASRTLVSIHHLVKDQRPTSAGRFLLSLSTEDLRSTIRNAKPAQTYSRLSMGPLTDLLTLAAPERVGVLVDDLLLPPGAPKPLVSVVKPLLDRAGDKYLSNILAAFEQDKENWNKFHLGQVLYQCDPRRFHDLGLNSARAALKGNGNHAPVGTWMVEEFGDEVLPDLVAYFQAGWRTANWGGQILDAAIKKMGAKALPVLFSAIERTQKAASLLSDSSLVEYARTGHFQSQLELRHRALQHLIALNDPAHDDRIETELRRSLSEPDPTSVVNFLNLVGRWKPQRLEKDVWGLLHHKTKSVRSAAARALGKLGDAALPQARELLRHKKADVRAAAVTLLISSGTDAAMSELESRLDEERSDDVRDEMLLGLAAAWVRQGRVVTRKDIEKRITKTADKLASPPAPWADPAKLPPLYWKDDGSKLSRDAVAYLIYRQSRPSQIRADVEVAPMYGLLDRAKSGPFAEAILRGFLTSEQDAGERWALALAGLVGDDRIVAYIVAQIRDWVDHNRGKLAEYAVQALALLGSDVALVAVDAMAIRYRSKMKNVGRAAAEAFVDAAAAQGVTPEELGDRVVPWLGFEPGKPRIIEAGMSRIEAGIGMDFKLTFRDPEKKKAVKSLPKTVAKEVLQEFKDLSANLREIVKAQLMRLENLLVRQRRWPVDAWRGLFLQHPLQLPFAVRLVWGHYDGNGQRIGTFRALEDRSLTTNQDDPYNLGTTGLVGMIHPLELSDDERSAWQNHLADYEIEPPFSQLERKVVHCTDEQAGQRMHHDLSGVSINGMTFKGRAERLGWYRGSVCDGGGITSYYKSFPASGTDVFLGLDGFYIGIDMYASINLGDVCFVKHGAVKVGSYTYDEPQNGDDPRIIPLGKVPPIVFSEVMGDLQKISGKSESDAGAEPAVASAEA